jgi:hypothetical protein
VKILSISKGGVRNISSAVLKIVTSLVIYRAFKILKKRQKRSPPIAGGLRVWLKESLLNI